jgi:hypothetical protein
MPKDLLKNVSQGAKTLGEGLSVGAKSISKKSGEFIKAAKLKIEMSNLESELENNMVALGKFVYLQYRDGQEDDSKDEIERLLVSSKALENDIANLAQVIERLTPGPPVRSNCQAGLSVTAKFCPNCGSPVIKDDPEE